MRFILLLATALILAAPAVQAQDALDEALVPETTPIEAALMYKKLLHREPAYDALVAGNPKIKNDPARFGNAVLMKQQHDALKKIHDGFTPNTVFMLRKRLVLTSVDAEKRIVAIGNLTADEPFLLPLNDTETYGVFLRNAKDIVVMAPPFEFESFMLLAGFGAKGTTFPAEILVKPLAADTEPFPTEGGGSVLPIVADVVEITLLRPNGRDVTLKKRFGGWTPAASRSLLDLKDGNTSVLK